MKRSLVVCAILAAMTAPVGAAVVINEVCINPPGSLDNTQEFIELLGPPNMKLDGYALAHLAGTQRKYYKFGTVPPVPAAHPEVDEFFSLDGLQLGSNGILVIGRGIQSDYGAFLSDARFRSWTGEPPTGLWNGFNDFPGGLENDTASTVVLIRNRPGATSGGGPTFSPPVDLRWGKDVPIDAEIDTIESTVCVGGPTPGEPCNADADCGGGVCRPGTCSGGATPGAGCNTDVDCGGGTCTPNLVTRLGNGSVDEGDPIGNVAGNTIDCKGQQTTDDTSDDLEVVDEVSFEDAQGYKYDFDARRVDVGSTNPKFKDRKVHTLDDPAGFNPDMLSRVDYRTRGNGWTPIAGATGEQTNGNNWQDTATEQWIRGDSTTGSGGQGSNPQIYYDISANTDPEAVQPYRTHVPRWLNDAIGTEFNFTTPNQYQVMAGRINPLAIPFIPGDVDRDGDCDAQDIAKMAAVFGDDNWIFSNSFGGAEQTNFGDPASQTRPWDVDLTGDNGVEASDLQWVLNFQGNTNGRVVGVRYDSTTPTPLGSGVVLNPNTGVTCTVSTTTLSLSGRPLSALRVGDLVQVTIRAQVTAGANTTAGQQNGIMQYVLDLRINTGARLRVTEEGSSSPFTSTRAIQNLLGSNGDRGIGSLNGHTTSFTQGLTSSVVLNRVTLQAVGIGAATVTVGPATEDPKFAASTPFGLKLGRTNNNGNPVGATFPSAINFGVTGSVRPDFNSDGKVTAGAGSDLEHLLTCRTGPEVPQNDPLCQDARLDGDADVDNDDFGIFQRCYTGPTGTPPQGCDN